LRTTLEQALVVAMVAIALPGCGSGDIGGDDDVNDAGGDAGDVTDGAPLPDAPVGSPDARTDSGMPASGQIVVEAGNPRWLAYEGGGPYFLCGPGDPEGFLYRGTRNGDGTRDGDQAALIAKMSGTGANGIYFQSIRSHGGDDSSGEHNPFDDSDPSNGIDDDILDQWEGWFTALEEAGVGMYFFFYDDSACVWGCSNEAAVPAGEQAFIETIVNRFEHHELLVWVIAEEYQEAFSPQRVSNIAAAIRAADDNDHVIGVHKLSGISFDEFANDPAIDQFAIQYNQGSASALHSGMVDAFGLAAGRYNLNMSESADHGTGAAAREKNWAVAMGGAYVMVLGWDIETTATGDLEDCGRLVQFMESTNFNTMEPRDDLAHGGTDYVLANPADTFILYAADLAGDLGVRDIDTGTYDFRWFDAVDGTTVDQSDIAVSAGDRTWAKPAEIGDQLAVWIRRSQ